jgi:hypothetical protein
MPSPESSLYSVCLRGRMYIAGDLLSLDIWRNVRNCERIRSLLGELCVCLPHTSDRNLDPTDPTAWLYVTGAPF